MDKEITYDVINQEDKPKYRTGLFVTSLVFLVFTFLLFFIVVGIFAYDYPEYTKDMGGLRVLELFSMIFANGGGVLFSFAVMFVFSLTGFLCGITSLKCLPNKATKVIAIISTVTCGIINAASMIPAVLLVFAILLVFVIFSFMLAIGM